MATTTPDVLDLERQVCFALAVASRRVIGLYRPLLEPMGLTHPQYLVMLALWQGGPTNLRSLGDRLALEPATLSPLLKRLEAIGYLTRTRDPEDERTLVVALTPAGQRLRKAALRIPPAIMKRLDMDVAELVELHGRLTDVIERTQPTA
jgi:DNA-binding MarR family transcriptional regulator